MRVLARLPVGHGAADVFCVHEELHEIGEVVDRAPQRRRPRAHLGLSLIHIFLLVRRRGVVPPFAPTAAQLAKAGLSTAPGGATATFAAAPQDLPVFSPEPPAAVPDAPAQVPHQVVDLDQLLDETPARQPEAGEPPAGSAPAAEPGATLTEPGSNDPLWQLPEDQS